MIDYMIDYIIELANGIEGIANKLYALVAFPFSVYISVCVLERVINDLLN